VVAAGTVVFDPPTELTEYEDDCIVLPVVFFQIVHEVAHRPGDVIPQLGVVSKFS
jgi:hypothetical protein